MINIRDWIMDNRLSLLLAVGTLFSYFWLYENRKQLKSNGKILGIVAIAHTLVGVLCVKLFAFLESGSMAGQSLFGAVFFMPAVYFTAAKVTKRRIADVFDIFSICMIFTLLCARLNCIFAGCCKGMLCPGSETLRWPTRELEIGFYIIQLIWLGHRVGKNKFKGTVNPLYMISYGIFRFIVEWFREADIIFGFVHIGHIWSIIATMVGFYFYYRVKKEKSGENHRKSYNTISIRTNGGD